MPVRNGRWHGANSLSEAVMRMLRLPRSAEVKRRFPNGRAVRLSPLVQRVTAPNHGMMTGPGTNTYLVGNAEVAVIDPGVDKAEHLDAVVEAAPGPIRWILVTHTHPDHSPGAASLARRTGAQVHGHHIRLQGKRDKRFRADVLLDDGARIQGSDFSLQALHTPGHAADHLCYLLEQERSLIAGDQVMDGATVVIAPPDGDMADYLASLRRLQGLPIDTLLPAHGDPLQPASAVLQEIIDHRLERESQVLAGLAASEQPLTAMQLVKRIYTDVPSLLHPMAARSVTAHLDKLATEGRVVHAAGDRWRLA